MLRRPATLAVLLAGAALSGCYAETLPATDVSVTSAVLHARGHTDSTPATVYFEYAPSSQGLDSSDSPFRTARRTIPANTPGAGKPDLEFHVGVRALQPSTSYDFRVCGREDSEATRCAATRSFTTGAGSPEVSFLPRPAFPVSLDADAATGDFTATASSTSRWRARTAPPYGWATEPAGSGRRARCPRSAASGSSPSPT